MSGWEYKVVPAPTKGQKAKGLKSAEARFAFALETLMNDMGREGWEFQRAETLPSIERSGLTGSTTEWRNMLVFRRPANGPMDDFEPELLPAPSETPEVAPEEAPEPGQESAQNDDEFVPGPGATQMVKDDGVEETSPVSGMTASLRKLADQRKGKDVKD